MHKVKFFSRVLLLSLFNLFPLSLFKNKIKNK